ncbi:MAG TPA: ATP-binding protein [Candidatus Methylomirabilis sp.]|nr:ATP-binding protein [Candidatus Methylomirabilis sp.]
MATPLPDLSVRARLLPTLHSLKVKFVAALVPLVCVAIGLSTWWNLALHRNHMLLATEDKGRALAQAIDRGIQVAMREGRSQDVQHILEEIAQDPDIEQIMIFDEGGKILRSSEPGAVGRTLDRDRLSRYLIQPDMAVTGLYENGKLIRSVVKRLRNRPECFQCHGSQATVNGILHVDMSFQQTQMQLQEMERSALWTVLLTAAILAAGGVLLMVRLVDRPIAGLMRAMAKVEGGDLETRATIATQDELGGLADSFNTMVEKLRAAHEEIEVYHRQRLDHAERLATVGELAASLAHEIKNPLAGIAGAVQVMADELPEDNPRKEIMSEVLAQVHRLDRTVRDLLAFARPGKPDVGPCDVHQVLDWVLLLLAEDPEAKRVRVVRSYLPGLPRVDADAKQLGQVFLNLVLNAIQAMPHGGQVSLRTGLREAEGGEGGGPRGRGDMVEVVVADTGPGIPPHLLDEIFKPFITTKHRGTGLGLAVSRRIVEDHGGWIAAESQPGHGATFRVCLPVRLASSRTGERRP